jgi:hypothetical protein
MDFENLTIDENFELIGGLRWATTIFKAYISRDTEMVSLRKPDSLMFLQIFGEAVSKITLSACR